MRQTTKAHRACRDPQILLAKSDYFPKEKEKEKDRICKVLFCQSQRKERFAQLHSKVCAQQLTTATEDHNGVIGGRWINEASAQASWRLIDYIRKSALNN